MLCFRFKESLDNRTSEAVIQKREISGEKGIIISSSRALRDYRTARYLSGESPATGSARAKSFVAGRLSHYLLGHLFGP